MCLAGACHACLSARVINSDIANQYIKSMNVEWYLIESAMVTPGQGHNSSGVNYLLDSSFASPIWHREHVLQKFQTHKKLMHNGIDTNNNEARWAFMNPWKSVARQGNRGGIIIKFYNEYLCFSNDGFMRTDFHIFFSRMHSYKLNFISWYCSHFSFLQMLLGGLYESLTDTTA